MIVSYVDLHATIQSTCRIVPPNADGTICYVDAVFHSILILDSAAAVLYRRHPKKRTQVNCHFLPLSPPTAIHLPRAGATRERESFLDLL